MNKHVHGDECKCGTIPSPMQQTMQEMDFERGIWQAAINNDVTRVERFLLRDTHPDVVDGCGYTAMHYASRNGSLDVCRVLLDKGANPNCVTSSGLATPLHRAAYAGDIDLCQLLLRHDADPSAIDADGNTVLHKAAEGGHYDMIDCLRTRFPSLNRLVNTRGHLPSELCSNKQALALLKPTKHLL